METDDEIAWYILEILDVWSNAETYDAPLTQEKETGKSRCAIIYPSTIAYQKPPTWMNWGITIVT